MSYSLFIVSQRPKQRMRQAIVRAAQQEFARVGFTRATLATIAARAHTSVGNIYKYFSNKEELFDAALPEELIDQLRRLLAQRVRALGVVHDVRSLDEGHPYHQVSRQLFGFTLEHRDQLLFLMRHADHPRCQGVVTLITEDLVRLAVAYAKNAYPGLKLAPAKKRTLHRAYQGFLSHIGSILEEETTEKALFTALENLATYHLAGLRTLFAAAAPNAFKSRKEPKRKSS